VEQFDLNRLIAHLGLQTPDFFCVLVVLARVRFENVVTRLPAPSVSADWTSETVCDLERPPDSGGVLVLGIARHQRDPTSR
jgi:hypothetical protein